MKKVLWTTEDELVPAWLWVCVEVSVQKEILITQIYICFDAGDWNCYNYKLNGHTASSKTEGWTLKLNQLTNYLTMYLLCNQLCQEKWFCVA